MRLIDSGLEILPLGSCIRDGMADRALGLRLSALLVQPLSERIQKRCRVRLMDLAPRPERRRVRASGDIDRCAERPSDSTTRPAIDSRRVLMDARQDAFADFRSVGGDPAIDPIRPCDPIW